MTDFIGSARYPMRKFVLQFSDKERAIWFYLVALRRLHKRVSPTLEGIAAQDGIRPASTRTVKRALARLRAGGLIRDIGWRFIWDRGQRVEVYTREIFGEQVTNDLLMVPLDVWAKLDKLPEMRGRGGFRKGAGRRKINQSGPPLEQGDILIKTQFSLKRSEPIITRVYKEINQSGPPLEQGDILIPRINQSGPLDEKSKWPPYLYPLDLGSTLRSSLLRKEERASRAANECFENQKPMIPSQPSVEIPEIRLSPTPTQIPSPSQTTRKTPLPGRLESMPNRQGSHMARFQWGGGVLPLPPQSFEITYTRPPPPKIPAEDNPEDQLRHIWKWYLAAARSREVDTKVLGNPLANVNKKFFLDAREVFLEHDIRPGLWCSWQMDRILAALPTQARRAWKPLPKFVLSTKTLTENRWMFRKEEPEDAIPTAIMSVAGTELWRRFKRLDLDLLTRRPTIAEEATRMVADHFPEGLAVARRACAEKTQAEWQEVLAQINRGNWLWPVKARG